MESTRMNLVESAEFHKEPPLSLSCKSRLSVDQSQVSQAPIPASASLSTGVQSDLATV